MRAIGCHLKNFSGAFRALALANNEANADAYGKANGGSDKGIYPI
jgi:hypothetical protein